MDHLPSASGLYPDVPFLVKEPYDDKGFFDFPTRKGYNRQALLERGDYGNRTAEELTSFIQSRLFFGLLCEVFETTWDIIKNDFVQRRSSGEQYLTTRRLSTYLEGWSTPLPAIPQRAAHRIKVELVLSEAKSAIAKYCSIAFVGFESIWPIDHSVALSLMILGETLTWAKNYMLIGNRRIASGWLGDDQDGWGRIDTLVKAVLTDGWCPASIHMLSGSMQRSVSAIFYASTFPVPPDRGSFGDHSRCTELRCASKFRSENTYEHKHVTPDCDCPFLEPCSASLQSIVLEGNVPLFVYRSSGTTSGNQLQVRAFEAGDQYIAVSHVWMDGLGNPRAIAVLTCQVQRLMKIFARLTPNANSDTPFWIDTFGIPIDNSGTRRLAINLMHRIYSLAHKTIVIDGTLLDSYYSLDFTETAMRISISNWMQRLWTMQEGVLSRSLYFCFQDGPIDIDAIIARYDTSRLSIGQAATAFYSNLLRDIKRRSGESGASAATISAIWKSLQWRKTTRFADEVLAVATMLDIPQEYLRDCPREVRMAKLLGEMPVIPSGFIFLPGSRLDTRGFRWAPASWMLSSQIDHPDPLLVDHYDSRYHGLLSPDGLRVRYPGFKLVTTPRGMNLLRANLKPSEIDADAMFQPHGFYFPANSALQEWYKVFYVDEPDSIWHRDLPPWFAGIKSDSELAIILCRRRPGLVGEIALLTTIELTPSESSDNGFLVTHLCRIKISLETRPDVISRLSTKFRQDPGQALWGEDLDETTLWIVD